MRPLPPDWAALARCSVLARQGSGLARSSGLACRDDTRRGLASSPITAMYWFFTVGVRIIGSCHDDQQTMCMANVVYGDVFERQICQSRPKKRQDVIRGGK